MDVEFLSRMIGELMLDHDTLGLPGLGSFVAEEMPASFSDKGYTVNPPYRRLSFTGRESHDGLLTKLYAGDNSLSEEEAGAILGSFLQDLADELKQRKTVELPGLGRLRATRENHFFFVADESLDISPDAFGLTSVSLKTHGHAALPEVEGLFGNKTEEIVPEIPAGPEQAAEPAESVTPAEPEKPSVNKAPRKQRRPMSPALRWTIALVAVVALFFGGFIALSRIAPDITDKLLYTQEELSIINYPEDGLGLPG